ncbi:MAG: type II secretion system F family protein [Caldilineaceae bacterium]
MQALLDSALVSATLMGCAVMLLALGLRELWQAHAWHKEVRDRLTLFAQIDSWTEKLQSVLQWLDRQVRKTRPGAFLARWLNYADLQWSVLLLITLWVLLFLGLMAALFIFFQLTLIPNVVLSLLATTTATTFFLVNRKDAYERALQAQTPDIALLISNALRAGQSLLYALREIELKLPRPASREFHELFLQINAGGKPMEQALSDFLARHPSEEMRILITALLVQRRAGGDLVTTLTNISLAIRARRRVRNEVDTITAEARQTSLLAITMPFIVLIILNRISPGMVTDFINSWYGLLFTIVVYGVPQVAAFFIIRRLGNVRV